MGLLRVEQAAFDEVTSSLDEDGEGALYAAICTECTTFISIGKSLRGPPIQFAANLSRSRAVTGHRSTIRQFHTHELQLTTGGGYTLVALHSSE